MSHVCVLLVPALLGLLQCGWAQSGPACPSAEVRCPGPLRYRPVDGSCNNLRRPSLGRASSPLKRVLRPDYGDEFGAPRKSRSGRPLPSTQAIVTKLFPQVDHPFHTTHLFVLWGQLVAHDFARIAIPLNRVTGPCCDADADSEECIPISVPRDDPFYAQFNIVCLPLTRTNTTACGDDIEQVSEVTHFLDASFLYGSAEQTTRRLRDGMGGRLRVQRADDGDFPPEVADSSATPCAGRTPCYDAGDVRVNQNPMLAALQTLWLREHNRVAGVLGDMNPLWNDERVFQEARRIVVAEYQHIVYHQWLQWLLGGDRVHQMGLSPHGPSPRSAYRDDVDPRTANDVTTGGYRALHSMVQGRFLVGAGAERRAERLGGHFHQPGPVLQARGGLLAVLQGLVHQRSQDQDRWMDNEVTQQYEAAAAPDGRRRGTNLAAIDIQRGRDHWLPGYNQYREHAGLPRARAFNDLLDTLGRADVDALRDVYEHVDDVDYYVGGLMEGRKRSNFLLGPTFQAVVEDQFWRWRFGDRFFYNFVGFPHSFTKEQIWTLQKASAGRLLCDNVRGFQTVPRDPFIKTGFRGNEDVPCDSLPEVDLSLWKEHGDQPAYGNGDFDFY